MKRIFLYGFFMVITNISCSKSDSQLEPLPDSNELILLSSIEMNQYDSEERAEFVYDDEHRLTEVKYSSKKQNSWQPIKLIAYLTYEQDKVTKVETKTPAANNNWKLHSTIVFKYGANQKISQYDMTIVDPAENITIIFNYDDKGRIVYSNSLVGDLEAPIKYNEQGNVVYENFNATEGPQTRTKTYELTYDSRKNFLAENNLGEFLLTTSLLPGYILPESLFSKNNFVESHAVRHSVYFDGTHNFSSKWDETRKYTNEYDENGYLKSYSWSSALAYYEDGEMKDPPNTYSGSVMFSYKKVAKK